MAELTQVLANGLILGGIYALVALGYTLVYGIMKFINFAHGEVFMIGAFVMYSLQQYQVNVWVAILVTMAICGVVGFCIERVAYRPLRGRDRLVYLITAVGVSLLLQSAAIMLWGGKNRVVQPVYNTTRNVFGAFITDMQIIIIGMSIVLMLVLHWFIKRSKMGKAIRAVADSTLTAAVVGIPVNRVISIVFVVGSLLAGAAGAMISMEQAVTPTMGVTVGIKAFTAAVVGGIGNIYGAFFGGYIIGILENFGAFWFPAGYKDAIAFVVLLVMLLVKPTGLLGKSSEEAIRE